MFITGTFQLKTLAFEKRCECCRVDTFKEMVVPLLCDDQSTESKIIKDPVTCKCIICE